MAKCWMDRKTNCERLEPNSTTSLIIKQNNPACTNCLLVQIKQLLKEK